MGLLLATLRFDPADRACVTWALLIHALSFLAVLGLVVLTWPRLRARGRRLDLVLAVLPAAAVLGFVVQYCLCRAVPTLSPWRPSADQHRAYFVGIPFAIHLQLLAVLLFWRYHRPPAAAADYGEPGPHGPGR